MATAANQAQAPGGPQACPKWGAMTPADLLSKLARQKPDAPFLSLDNEDVLSFWQFDAQVDRLAAFLAHQGLKPGDCVLLRLGRRVQGLIALLAAGRAGLDCCVVPQTMSAREASHGSRAFLPKAVIEAGEIASGDDPTNLRIMEIAANLFTVRFAAGFQGVCDGMIDMDDDLLLEAQADEAAHFKPIKRPADKPVMVHTLRPGPTGRIDRLSRNAQTVLSQGLACAMVMKLTSRSAVGLPFDTASMPGFLCGVVPCLITGSRLELFNALDPLVADHLTYWADQDKHHCALLPYALSVSRKADDLTEVAGQIVWLAQGVGTRVEPDAQVLVDCAGLGFVPGLANASRELSLKPGAITASNSKGTEMVFGAVGLKPLAEDKTSTGQQTVAEVLLDGPVAARSELGARTQSSGVFARNSETPSGQPCFTLAAHDPIHGPLVSGQPVMMATINRSLSLTGRWQDAAAFAVADAVVGNRIEVAIEPRIDSQASGEGSLPTLQAVRSMLAESGIGDAGLPTRIHLVQSIPRSAAGHVLTDALQPFEPPVAGAQDASHPASDANSRTTDAPEVSTNSGAQTATEAAA